MTALASSSFSNTASTSTISQFPFPRTGKRGVPQQFPRRLYEMLDSETRQIEGSVDHPKVISWSNSGKAFRIFDVADFADDILPKYFRTKKFSSFQRNLNLYGFTKVRRGPETDMYAHPSFVRDQPQTLVHLRKTTTAARRRMTSESLVQHHQQHHGDDATRPVSPSLCSATGSSSSSSGSHSPSASPVGRRKLLVKTTRPVFESQNGSSNQEILRPCFSRIPRTLTVPTTTTGQYIEHSPRQQSSTFLSSKKINDRGKLDLLALALEKEFASCK